MSSLPFDPFRAERALHWRNRVGRWRADAAQTLLHAAALLALVALLAPPLLHGIEAAGPVLHAALQRWPLALGLAAFALLALRQAGRQHALRRREAREWWLAQPIAPALRRRRAWRIATLEALLQFALAGLVLGLARVAPGVYGVCAALVLAAAAAGPLLADRIAARQSRRERAGSRVGDAGAGRLWRWQRVETGVALRGRQLALGLWALLLVPMGSGPATVVATLAAGLLLAILATAWTRVLAVLPQAQAWLQSQPLAGWRWLAALVAVPAALLLLATSLIASALAAAGAPGLALAAVVALVAGGVLQFAVVFAWRAAPRRIALQTLLQLMLLVAVVQAFAPLAALLWLLQVALLLRRGVRA